MVKKFIIDSNQMNRFHWVNPYFKEVMKKNNLDFDYLHPDYIKWAKGAYNMVRRNYDMFLAFTGRTGSGKSNLCNLVGLTIDPNYSLDTHVLYSPNIEEVKKKMEWRKIIAKGETPGPDALPPYSLINIDEAIKVLYKMEQWSPIQRFLKKLFEIARVENKIIGMCIPKLTDLSSSIRSKLSYWFDIYYRGYNMINSPSKNTYTTDVWDLAFNERQYNKGLRSKKYCEITPRLHTQIVQKNCRNYVSDMSFPKLPDELDVEYTRLKNLHGYDDALVANKEDTVNKYMKKIKEQRKYLVKKLYGLGVLQKDIAKELGLSHGAVSDWVHNFKGVGGNKPE